MSSSERSKTSAAEQVTEYNIHIPVLLTEVLSFVRTDIPNMVIVDMTIGRAGHSSNILEMVDNTASLYGFDRDPAALSYSEQKLSHYSQSHKLFHSKFSQAIPTLKEYGLRGADFILMDIGVSSPQFDDPERGFSYRYDAPLDMRMDNTQKLTAREVVNTYSADELKRILFEYGGEKFAGPIARKIVEDRAKKPIETTFELVDVIKKALPERILRKKGHPAKQTFMALRYEVNDEKNELINGLSQAVEFLNPMGRVAIITFNSEEDEIAKNIFMKYAPKKTFNRFLPIPTEDEKCPYEILTKKPILPDKDELEFNPRSESAKMRVIERRY